MSRYDWFFTQEFTRTISTLNSRDLSRVMRACVEISKNSGRWKYSTTILQVKRLGRVNISFVVDRYLVWEYSGGRIVFLGLYRKIRKMRSKEK